MAGIYGIVYRTIFVAGGCKKDMEIAILYRGMRMLQNVIAIAPQSTYYEPSAPLFPAAPAPAPGPSVLGPGPSYRVELGEGALGPLVQLPGGYDYSPLAEGMRLMVTDWPGSAAAAEQEPVQMQAVPGLQNAQEAPGEKNATLGEAGAAHPQEGCSACSNRTYMDGSSDSTVSFQTPVRINPHAVAAKVASHEQEHVFAHRRMAEESGRKVMSQTVRIKYACCPECGARYVAGGVTRTVTAKKMEGRKAVQADGKECGH